MRRCLVIGAGSSGLGAAIAALTRGWEVTVVDKGYIAGGTSAASTKLIHGGIRYLEKAFTRLDYQNFSLVRQALRERSWMLKALPALSYSLPIAIPIRGWFEGVYYRMGIGLYELLAGKGKLAPSGQVPKTQAQTFFPSLRQAVPLLVYWDGGFYDRQYALYGFLHLMQRYGLKLSLHTQITQWHYEKEYWRLSGFTPWGPWEWEGDWVLNCAGPWADLVRQQVDPTAPPRLQLSQGTHVVFRREDFPLEKGFLVPHTEDGRILFILPWRDAYVLVGTTDVRVDQPGSPLPMQEEIDYLRAYVARYFTVSWRPVSVFSGYRPLVKGKSSPTAQLLRSHRVEIWPEKKFLSLLGGKWTTFRSMGEDALRMLYQAEKKTDPRPEPPATLMPDLSLWRTYQQKYPRRFKEGLPFVEGDIRFAYEQLQAYYLEDVLDGLWGLEKTDLYVCQELAPQVAAIATQYYDMDFLAPYQERIGKLLAFLN
ncbi:MAG: FAD-dependent oxidoreductase [Bacteroidia bacterium]